MTCRNSGYSFSPELRHISMAVPSLSKRQSNQSTKDSWHRAKPKWSRAALPRPCQWLRAMCSWLDSILPCWFWLLEWLPGGSCWPGWDQLSYPVQWWAALPVLCFSSGSVQHYIKGTEQHWRGAAKIDVLFSGFLLVGGEATDSLNPLRAGRYLSILPKYKYFSFSHWWLKTLCAEVNISGKLLHQ